MCLVSRIPLFNNISILVKNLDMRSGKLLLTGNINLTDAYRCHIIFYQNHTFIRYCCCSLCLIYSSIFFQSKGCVTGYCVSVWCYCLTKSISLSWFQIVHYMRFLTRCPFINNLTILINNLDMCSLQFFLVSCIHFADLH